MSPHANNNDGTWDPRAITISTSSKALVALPSYFNYIGFYPAFSERSTSKFR